MKNFGNRLEIKNVWKQVRDKKVWKQIKDGAQGLLLDDSKNFKMGNGDQK